jgi:hypothetical protein
VLLPSVIGVRRVRGQRLRVDAAVDETVAVPVSQSPAALALGKSAFYAIENMDLDTALDHLHSGLTAVSTTGDADLREPATKHRIDIGLGDGTEDLLENHAVRRDDV